ncbi:MAG: gamma-glutamylcyclotransferase [Sulfitobacter sp.]|nr:gamma-glutamylcyclotransferase [Sulfitobacter sp.]
MTPYFFGYGSLVNRDTHDYGDCHPAQLHGWRRAWVRTELRDRVFLTVHMHGNSVIDGLVAAVPNADWGALDLREYGYNRLSSGGAVKHPLKPAPDVEHYAIPPDAVGRQGDHVILLSYLDVVVQGFYREFGEEGVQRFFDTTDGWETPVFNDRDAPRYPRHRILKSEETELVDHHLNQLSALLK